MSTGKTLRRWHDNSNGLAASHLVSVWSQEAKLTLAQVATEAKSNEITAISELLELISLKGTVITIGAMGTQREIVQQIVAGGGDYVLPTNGNQPALASIAHGEGGTSVRDCVLVGQRDRDQLPAETDRQTSVLSNAQAHQGFAIACPTPLCAIEVRSFFRVMRAVRVSL